MRRKPFGVVVCVVVCLLVVLALCDRSWAQQPADNKSAVNPLVRVLQAKGILSAEEAAQISQASSASDADRRLAKLLLMKGVISQADYDQTVGAPAMMNASTTTASSPTAVAAVYRVPISNGVSAPPARTPPPEGPKVILTRKSISKHAASVSAASSNGLLRTQTWCSLARSRLTTRAISQTQTA